MSARKQATFYGTKTFQFRRNIRRQELDNIFTTNRNQMLQQEEKEYTSKSPIKLTEDMITLKIERLYQNSADYAEALDSLWKDCLQKQKIKLFSTQSISKLCIELMRLKRTRSLPQALNSNFIMMLIWIIGNWCYYFHSIPPSLSEMIDDLIDLLNQNINPKINHLIIYLFTNTCIIETIRVRLMVGNAVKAITRCTVFENKETDISTFLCNFICNLPYTYQITEDCKENIIQFLKKTLQLSKTDKDLRIDSILIVSKMLIINDGKFHRDVVLHLTPNLRLYIEKLDDIIREEATQDIFSMLTNLYRQRNYHHSELYFEEMYDFIWKAVERELAKERQELGDRADIIKNKIWEFMNQFCQICSPIIDNALHYLYNQCLSKEIGDYQQRAVKILAKNYHDYSENTFYFWSQQLIELYSDEQLCIDLLKVIKKCLDNTPNPKIILQTSEKFCDLLNKLIFSQNSEISELSSSIIDYNRTSTDDSEMQQEKDHSKNSNKSFNTACDVLLTPLHINSYPLSKIFPSNISTNHE